MTAYCIDPFTGSDSNNGTSWGTPFKTYYPFESGAVVLVPGDLVKIAKTSDVENPSFTAPSTQLASVEVYSHGWSVMTQYTLTGLSSRVKSIVPWVNLTGITFSAIVNWNTTEGSDFPQTNGLSWPRFVWNETAWVADGKLLHIALGATANLSSFGRIEFRAAGYGTNGPTATEQELKLCLCSDAVGDTVLLSIPFYVGADANATIIAYEGALPDGVNSVSIRLGNVKGGGADVSITSLIATHAYSSANYLGHYTQVRFGSHEAAYFVPIWGFNASGGTPTAYITTSITGPAALNNTTFNIYFRKSISWARYPFQNYDGVNNYGTAKSFTTTAARTLVSPTGCKMRVLFNLLDLNGSAGNPIQIVGGYDPGTDTVTGRTALLSRHMDDSSYNRVSAFMLGNTSYVTIKNIDVFSYFTPMWHITETSHDVKYENCTIIQCTNNSPNPLYASTAARETTDTGATLYNFTFKDSFGTIWVYYATTNLAQQMTAAQLYSFTYDNCIYNPYYGPILTLQTGNTTYPFLQPLTLVGDLKVYCPGHYVKQNSSTLIAGTNIKFPPIVTGAAGTVYAYGGGVVQLAPGVPTNQVAGVYTYPDFEFENTIPMFCDGNSLHGDTQFGSVDSTAVPYLKLTFTAVGWCSRSLNATYYADYRINWMMAFEGSAVPIDVQQVVLDGSPYASSMAAVHYVVAAHQTQFSVRNLTLGGSFGATWVPALLQQMNLFSDSNYAPINPSPLGPNLHIFDTILVNRANSASILNMLQDYSSLEVSGHVEIRNVTWTNTHATFYNKWTPYYIGQVVVRYVNCNITNAGTASPIDSFGNVRTGWTNHHQQGGYGDAGIVVKNSTMGVSSTTIVNYTGLTTQNDWYRYETFSWQQGITVCTESTDSYVTYWPGIVLSRDYAVYNSTLFSWKSTLRMVATMPHTCAYPLASVPVTQGKTVTITLYVRRSNNTTCFGGLLAYHHGCAGKVTAADYQEITAFVAGAANVWEMVQLQFVCQQTGIIDLFVSHFGASGTNLWFDDLKIIEQ